LASRQVTIMSIEFASAIESRHFGYDGMPLTGKQKKIIGADTSSTLL
jgi:hypothetical protein